MCMFPICPKCGEEYIDTTCGLWEKSTPEQRIHDCLKALIDRESLEIKAHTQILKHIRERIGAIRRERAAAKRENFGVRHGVWREARTGRQSLGLRETPRSK